MLVDPSSSTAVAVAAEGEGDEGAREVTARSASYQPTPKLEGGSLGWRRVGHTGSERHKTQHKPVERDKRSVTNPSPFIGPRVRSSRRRAPKDWLMME